MTCPCEKARAVPPDDSHLPPSHRREALHARGEPPSARGGARARPGWVAPPLVLLLAAATATVFKLHAEHLDDVEQRERIREEIERAAETNDVHLRRVAQDLARIRHQVDRVHRDTHDRTRDRVLFETRTHGDRRAR